MKKLTPQEEQAMQAIWKTGDLTGEEVNAKIKRSSLHSSGAMNKEAVFKKYRIDKDILENIIVPLRKRF